MTQPHTPPPVANDAMPRTGASHANLRKATSALHARVDGMFARGLDSMLAYRRYVLGMHRFAVDYEVAIDAVPRHSSWLASDLVALSLPPLPAEGMRRPIPDQAERLGWEYVMAGSSLGARKLVRDAAALGIDATGGAGFLGRHAASDDWVLLQSRLAALDVSDARRMALAMAGANDAFALVRNCFERSFDVLPDENG